MNLISAFSLKFKVPFVIVTLCVLVALATGAGNYIQFRNTLISEEKKWFSEFLSMEVQNIEKWFEDTRKDVELIAKSPGVIHASELLVQASGGSGHSAELGQAAGIGLAPRGAAASPDGVLGEELQQFLEEMKLSKGFGDVLIFDPQGKLVFSTQTNSDLGANFVSGLYSSTGIGQAVRSVYATGETGVVFTDYAPYEPIGNAPAAFMTSIVKDSKGGIAGAFAVRITAAPLQNILNKTSDVAEMDHVFLLGADHKLRSSFTSKSGTKTVLDTVFTGYTEDFLDGKADGFTLSAEDEDGVDMVAGAQRVQIQGAEWTLFVERQKSEVLMPLVHMRNIMALGGLLAIGILAFVGWGLSRFVTLPILDLESNLRALSNDDFSTEVKGTERGDEFGESARALSDLSASLEAAKRLHDEVQRKSTEQNEVVDKLTDALDRMSQGDLSCELKEPFAREFEGLRTNFNQSLRKLNGLILEVISSCESINSQSSEISKSADNLSNRTENQAATLEETAAALNELTSGVKNAASSASEVETIVIDARGNAESSQEIVQEAIAAMEEIEESSNQISEIIGVIDEIAFQTNLLALNAGVEAGRAGEAGKGFAVVASEVGALAQRSSEAAKAIKKLISSSARHVSKGVKNVSDTGSAIATIVERVSHISELMKETASSAKEQSHCLDEINIGVNQLDQVTQQNAAMVEQSTEASHDLRSKSEKLFQIVGQFQMGAGTRAMPSAPSEDHIAAEPSEVFAGESVSAGAGSSFTNAASGVWQKF